MYKRLLWLGRLNLEPHFSTQYVLSEIKTVFVFKITFHESISVLNTGIVPV